MQIIKSDIISLHLVGRALFGSAISESLKTPSASVSMSSSDESEPRGWLSSNHVQ